MSLKTSTSASVGIVVLRARWYGEDMVGTVLYSVDDLMKGVLFSWLWVP